MRVVATPASKGIIWSTFALSVVGVAISAYLTAAHFEGASILACSDSGIINCTTVTTSPQSYFLGIPVAILGLAFYLGMTALNSPWVWRRTERWIALARAGAIVSGMVFVLWLIAAELLIIDHICLWCTGVHVVTFALAIVLSRILPAQLLGE